MRRHWPAPAVRRHWPAPAVRRHWPEAVLAGIVVGLVAPVVVMFLLSFFVPYCAEPPAGPVPTTSFAGPAVPHR